VSTRGAFGGQLVPLVILDTSDRPDIDELIRVHGTPQHPGDVKIQWVELAGHKGFIALILTFLRPSEATVIIEFDIVKQGVLVEHGTWHAVTIQKVLKIHALSLRLDVSPYHGVIRFRIVSGSSSALRYCSFASWR
jgi:hypothetical protein